MFFKEFNHFFRDPVPDDSSSGTSDIYIEYTSSKQRNREKKFLKERHFVPDKDNPKRGMIDSTEIDPKTGKPIRVQFSFDNESLSQNSSALARGTDFIHMDERELQKHPDISRSTFAHEDGHLILNRDPKKSEEALKRVTNEIQKSDFGKLMNDHGNSAAEYIADRNSLYKVGYDQTVRMLKHVRDDTAPYNRSKKSINKDPYKYILANIGPSNLKDLPKEVFILIGFASSEKMRETTIKRYENQIKAEISFKHQLIRDKKYDASIGKFIDSRIERYRNEIDDLKTEITKSKDERRAIHQKFINGIKASYSDEAKLKKELIDGIDELEKQNRVELDLRIKMLSFWNENKTVSESYGPEEDHTTGTCEFDEPYNDDPDDCYCESKTIRSNSVYTDNSKTKVNNFTFDKVYFGSSNKMPNTMKLDGPLFVTPYAGVASIFAVRPQDLRKYGVTREMRVNRDYDEWKLPLTQLKEPFSTIHVVLQGLDRPFTMKPVVENATGYIYAIEVTPEIKDHIYQSSKMNKEKELCIDGIDSIDFSNMKKIDVKVCIRGDNDTVQEAYDAVTGKEIPIDHAYTMDEMKDITYSNDDLDKIQSEEELNAFYTELKSKLGQDETIQESKMPAKKRNNLDNKDFGLVYKDDNGKTVRKYPLNDKAHVASAARLFGHCPDKYKKRLANKILRKAHEFGMDTSGWDTVNKAAKQ